MLLYQIAAPDKALQQYFDVRQSRNKLQVELKEVKEENARLSREIRMFNNSTMYQRKVIRTQMGYAEPGEILYIPVEP